MEDLLRKYRRAARLNDWEECIRCLRQLTANPDEGAAWQKDLEALETQAMDGIRDELPSWIEHGRSASMEKALADLASFSDTPRRRLLMADVARALENGYRARLLENGKSLLAEARAAFDLQDRHRLIHAIRQYQKLNENVYFDPTTAMSAQFSELFESYKVAVRDEEQQRHFDTALSELLVELGKDKPGDNLVQIWRRLKACGEDLSPELTERAQKVVRKIERNRRSVRRVAIMSAAVIGIVLGTGISSILLQWQRQKTQDDIMQQLDRQWEAASPEKYVTIMETVSRHYPFLLRREAMRNRAKRVGDFESLLRSRQALFDQRLKAFQEVLDRSGDWDTEVLLKRRNEVDRLAQEAREALVALGAEMNPARMRAAIDNWSEEVPDEWKAAAAALLAWVESPRTGPADLDPLLEKWEQFKSERQGRIDLAFNALIEQADVTLTEINTQTAEEEALRAPRQLLEKASRMQGVSTNLYAGMTAVQQRVDALGADILRRQQLVHEMETAASLPAYLAAMQNYRNAFPEHVSGAWTDGLLARADFYRSILSPAASAVPGLAGPRAELAAWDAAREKNWPEVRARLLSLANEKRLVDLRTFSLGRWQNGVFAQRSGFLEGEFRAGPYDRRKGAVVTGIQPVIEGKTYFPNGNDVEPDFQFTTLNRALGDYIGRPVLMPHCRLVEELIGSARTHSGQDTPPDLFLAQTAESLAQQEAIPPLLRLRLIQFLAEQLVILAPEGGRGLWTDFLAAAGRIGGEINWLCTENREVVVANTHAKELLERHFAGLGLARCYAYYLAALREAVAQSPVWVGYASWTGAEPQPVLRPDVAAKELWVFRPEPSGAVWLVAALQEKDGWRLRTPLQPGEPIYAAPTAATTCEKLNRLRQEAQAGQLIQLPAVKGWPQVKCGE